MNESVEIISRDFWFKVVEMLQQNWALLDIFPDGSCKVFFVDDGSGVFDEIEFGSVHYAVASLTRNGFKRYAGNLKAQSFICPPDPPFIRRTHPNGPIYSSGKYWK